jgi:hypothetical protein
MVSSGGAVAWSGLENLARTSVNQYPKYPNNVLSYEKTDGSPLTFLHNANRALGIG